MNELPNASNLLKPILLALRNLGGSGTVEQIDKEVKRILDIPEYLSSIIRMGNRTELSYRLSWARTKGRNLGFLDRTTFKVWSLTDKGNLEISK